MTATTLARKPRRTRDAQESRRLLVEAAGNTPGTFYTHFPDKKTIFLEVYQAWVDSELIDLAAGFRSKGPDHRERLARTILHHHKKWKIFRASLRALYAIDPEVRTARL